MIQGRVKNPLGSEIIDQQWYESGVIFIALLNNLCASVEEEGRAAEVTRVGSCLTGGMEGQCVREFRSWQDNAEVMDGRV